MITDGGIRTMSKWKDLRKELDITPEEENVIELEKECRGQCLLLRGGTQKSC